MTIARSKLTAQSQISVPAEVRRRLGIGPGSILEWEEEDEKIVVRRAGRSCSLIGTEDGPEVFVRIVDRLASLRLVRQILGTQARQKLCQPSFVPRLEALGECGITRGPGTCVSSQIAHVRVSTCFATTISVFGKSSRKVPVSS